MNDEELCEVHSDMVYGVDFTIHQMSANNTRGGGWLCKRCKNMWRGHKRLLLKIGGYTPSNCPRCRATKKHIVSVPQTGKLRGK